jgi:hypothetical protein
MLGKKRGASLFSKEEPAGKALPQEPAVSPNPDLPPDANTVQMVVLGETYGPKLPENLTQYSSYDGTIPQEMREEKA